MIDDEEGFWITVVVAQKTKFYIFQKIDGWKEVSHNYKVQRAWTTTYVSSVKGWDYIFENDAKVKSQKMPKSQSFCPEERVFVGSRAKLHTAP